MLFCVLTTYILLDDFLFVRLVLINAKKRIRLTKKRIKVIN